MTAPEHGMTTAVHNEVTVALQRQPGCTAPWAGGPLGIPPGTINNEVPVTLENKDSLVAMGVCAPGHTARGTIKDQVAVSLHHKAVAPRCQLLSWIQPLARMQRVSGRRGRRWAPCWGCGGT